MKREAVLAAIREPVPVLPVNEIFSFGWSTRAWPASAPNPVTTFTAPGGKPACRPARPAAARWPRCTPTA